MKNHTSYYLKGSLYITRLTIFTILVLTGCNQHKPVDSKVLDAITNGDNTSLNEYLKKGIDINREFEPEDITPLNWAISNDQLTAAYLLVENGADVELISDQKTPLMYTARYNRPEIAKLLISRGADINRVNRDSNSAFHYAAKYNNADMLELLYGYGAEINRITEDDWTALDYSIINNRPAIVEYLKSIGARTFNKKIEDSFDGPYIDIISPREIYVKYLAHDSASGETTITGSKISATGNNISFQGINPDNKSYTIRLSEEIPPSQYIDPLKIIVIGDIHGQYGRMLKMLKSAGVIDNNLNWTWGDGHLVFIGDIFDRGTGVMEALWLIYSLEGQAASSNGRVHLLLGNHEMMILDNDIRYLANKYYNLTSNLGIDYFTLFNKESILGRWIRSKNSIEIIGSTMFVHAGASQQVASMNLPIEKINSAIREILNNPSDTTGAPLKNLLEGNLGPLWYRGYAKSSGNYEIINQQELEMILSQYSAEMVVIGHTEFDSVGIINNKRTIHVNIPLADKNIIEQALLIENGSYYRISSDMTKILLK